MLLVPLQTVPFRNRLIIDIGFVMDAKELCLICVLLLICGSDAMSRQQLKKTGKMLKNTCVKKIGVAEDMISTIEQGNFIEDPKVMCYIACILEMSSVVKNNKINYEASMKQIDMMYPPELKESAKASATSCKDVQKKYKDLCEASYWTAKCIYEFKPEDFVFA